LKPDIDVIDEEEGNKFLLISLRDNEDASKKTTIITSTDDLKRIIKATEGDWEQLLKDAIKG